jgi:hypothetical protein
MPSAKTINLRVTAQTKDFEAKLAKLPGVTEKEAKKMAKALGKGFDKASRDADRAAKRTKKSWDRSFQALQVGGTSVGRVFELAKSPTTALTLGVVALGAAMFKSAHAMSEYVDKITNMSAMTGLSTTTLQGLEAAAGASGLSIDKLKTGLSAFTLKLGQAVTIGGASADVFERLGVSTMDAAGNMREADVVFRETVDALAAMESPTERSANALELFGAKGAGIVAVLGEGSGALADWTAEADRYGTLLNSDTIAASARMDESSTRLTLAFKGLTNTLGTAATPAIATLTEALAGAVRVMTQSIKLTDKLADGLAFGLLSKELKEALRAEQAMIDVGELLQPNLDKTKKGLVAAAMAAEQHAEGSNRSTEAMKRASEEAAKQARGLKEMAKWQAEVDKVVMGADLSAYWARVDAISDAWEAGLEAAKAQILLTDVEEKYQAKMAKKEAVLQSAIDKEWDLAAAKMQAAAKAGEAIRKQDEETLKARKEHSADMAATMIDSIQAANDSISELLTMRMDRLTQAGEEMTDAQRKEYRRLFYVQKAFGINSVVIDTVQGMIKAFAQLGPIAGAIAAGAIGTQGTVSTAMIASQQPSFHTGGMVQPDETLAKVLTGEGVLSRQGVDAIGGPGAVNRANAGTGQAQVIQMVYKHRVLDTVIKDQLRTNTSLKRAIRGNSRVGHS